MTQAFNDAQQLLPIEKQELKSCAAVAIKVQVCDAFAKEKVRQKLSQDKERAGPSMSERLDAGDSERTKREENAVLIEQWEAQSAIQEAKARAVIAEQETARVKREFLKREENLRNALAIAANVQKEKEIHGLKRKHEEETERFISKLDDVWKLENHLQDDLNTKAQEISRLEEALKKANVQNEQWAKVHAKRSDYDRLKQKGK